MTKKKISPITVFGVDNGHCEIYNLTRDQLKKLWDADDWETVEKFKISPDNNLDYGYVPDYVVKLADIYGFDVESN